MLYAIAVISPASRMALQMRSNRTQRVACSGAVWSTHAAAGCAAAWDNGTKVARFYAKSGKKIGASKLDAPLVREMGLEPTRRKHTHLKRACLPIPALPHKAMPWHCKKYFSIPAAKKQGLFGLFFKLLTTVSSRAKIVRYTASFTPFSRIAAKNFNFFQNRACIFAQALIY